MEEEEIDAETGDVRTHMHGGGDIRNQNPEVLEHAGNFLQLYGWQLLIVAAVLIFLYQKYLRQAIISYLRADSVGVAKKTDVNEFASREAAVAAARLKMQQRQDEAAAAFREKQAMKQNSLAASSEKEKTKPDVCVLPRKPKSKSLRPNDYNPLMGPGGGGSSYRPSRSSGLGGG